MRAPGGIRALRLMASARPDCKRGSGKIEKALRPPGFGFFYSLPVQEQHALVEFSRSTVRDMRRIDREHNAEVAAYVKSKAKTASEEELLALCRVVGEQDGTSLEFITDGCLLGFQDAEIDLSDGEIRVQTEEGEVAINIDEEDGSFEMSVDGSQVVDAQVDGEDGEINIQTEDGEATIDVDGDTGTVTVIELA